MRFLIILILAILSGAGGAGAAWVLRSAPAEAAAPASDAVYSYVELQNQFVVPLTRGEAIIGLVAVSLAVEGREGSETAILEAEPRLRDAFLRVLFDHARAGGFAGDFTSGTSMSELRTRLDGAAREAMGSVVEGVLITSVARQDL